MSFVEIISDLKSRGERNIEFREDGTIVSCHGKTTTNFWQVIDGKLVCYDCRSFYSF